MAVNNTIEGDIPATIKCDHPYTLTITATAEQAWGQTYYYTVGGKRIPVTFDENGKAELTITGEYSIEIKELPYSIL